MKKKLKPLQRGESRPAPLPDQRLAVAERADHGGQNGYAQFTDWNNHSAYASANGYGSHGQTYAPPPPPPVDHPTYFQVLFQQILKRYKLAAGWLLIAAVAAYLVVTQYGKPTWKAEGSLYYSPDYGYSSNAVYRPPNIQTILALAKSSEVLEKACRKAEIGVGADALQSKLNVAILKQSDIIAVSFEALGRNESEKVANAVMEMAIEQYELLRRKLSAQAVVDLDENLTKTDRDVLAKRNELNEKLGRKDIFDLKTEMMTVTQEVSAFENRVTEARNQQEAAKFSIQRIDEKIKNLLAEPQGKELSIEQLSQLSHMRDLKDRQRVRKEQIAIAEPKLKALQRKYEQYLPLARQGYVSKQEMSDLEAEIRSLRVTVEGTKETQKLDEELNILEKQILGAKSGAGLLPLQQFRWEKMKQEVELESMPKRIENLEKVLKERRERQKFLQSVEREAMPIQQEIEQLQLRLNKLSIQKQEHEKLEKNKKGGELSVFSSASAGGAPMASNHMKLVFMVFGMAVLLFVGFVAFFDMPKAMPARPHHTPTHAMPYGYGPHPSQLPVPVWNQPIAPVPHAPPQPQPTAQQPGRSPGMSNEHLRALAERIDENVSEPGVIVLFTPTCKGLRVENLLGDLGCFLKADGAKVLVFESRTAAENPSYPAWTGPSSREVSEQLEAYLEGRHERVMPCFAETLISSIDYARGDLSRHLTGVMAMYRFRRLMQEMKQRYAAVLMITPERLQAKVTEQDVFTTLGEGIVVVINEDADPEDVENYLRELRNSETPVFGAVTVPPPGV